MIDDLIDMPFSAGLSFDVCIIGGGPAGITIAREFIGSGISVCLVESGGYKEEADTHALYEGQSVGHLVKMADGRHRVFGGSATKWAGRCAELDPMDFQVKPWVKQSGWPFGIEELAPYYARAKIVANFRAPWLPQEEVVSQLGLDLPEFRYGMLKSFVWRVASPDTKKTIWSKLQPGYRKAFNWANAYREELRRDEKTRVLLHANLAGFEPSADGSRLDRIEVSSLDGARATIEAKQFVFCCSGIENARLLMNLPSRMLDRVNAHDVIGRFLNQHPRGSLGTIEVDERSAKYIQRAFNNFCRSRRFPVQYRIGLSLSDRAQREYEILNASAAFYYEPRYDTAWASIKRIVGGLRSIGYYKFLWRDLFYTMRGFGVLADNVVRRFVLGLHVMHKTPIIHVQIDLEQEPNRESRIMLSWERDPFGMRRALADWRISDLDRRTARCFAAFLDEEIRGLGLGWLEQSPWLTNDAPLTEDDLGGNFHFIGTTRMSDDPEDGVVDRNCRVHGAENLYVAGSSVFSTGGHANPTLTIVALAIRTADHLKQILARPERAEEPACTHELAA